MTKIAILAFILLAGAAPSPAAESLSFRSWKARAERQEKEKDLEGAHSSWSNALSTWRESDGKPARAKAWCARAALREKSGDSAGAVSDYTDCLETDKKNAKAFHRRGTLLLKAGKRVDAMADFYKAIALDIRFAAAYQDRARAYEEQGELAFAKEDYKRACELGVREGCEAAKRLKPGAKPAPPSAGPAKPATPEPPALEPVPPAPADAFPPEAAPGAGKASKKKRLPYTPKFSDCRELLQACLDEGGSFGACVAARPRCDEKPAKGCCPQPCLRAFTKAAAAGSEAQAFRQHFSADSACAAPPPSDADE